MDIITLWSRIILPLTILIFVIYVIISSNKAAKELEQKKSEANNQIDASVNNKDSLPPFRDNVEAFLPETELAHQTAETTKAEIPMVAEQTKPETVQEPVPESTPVEPPPVPVDSRTPLPTKSVPVTSLIDLSPETFRQGIILAEILGRPKGLRHRT
jgi:predicted metal-dependent peptidase